MIDSIKLKNLSYPSFSEVQDMEPTSCIKSVGNIAFMVTTEWNFDTREDEKILRITVWKGAELRSDYRLNEEEYETAKKDFEKLVLGLAQSLAVGFVDFN